MANLKFDYLKELDDTLRSGEFQDFFMYSGEERRLEMLEFLERLMELGELADEVATRIIFRKKDTES
jgi:hypothetical protein